MEGPVDNTVAAGPKGSKEGLENTLACVWCWAFNLDHVDVEDNFFELGGDSLLAMTLAERLAAELGVELPVVAVFQNPTIRELAGYLRTEQPFS